LLADIDPQFPLALTSHYLGRAPRTMADKHYVTLPQRLVDVAIKSLRNEFGVI
jgi:hypothetical protein